MQKEKNFHQWQKDLFLILKNEKIKQVSFVPDAGHAGLITLVNADSKIKSTVLTTEQEGVALSCGAWLGGEKSVLLMQSSGVGNCINMFSILKSCNFPFCTFVTMRGEYKEFNSWQKPMGTVVKNCFELFDFIVFRINSEKHVSCIVPTALKMAYDENKKVAILLSQKFVGKKIW